LFRRGEGLQLLSGIKAIALDKTGTLTIGKPSIECVQETVDHTAEILSLQSRSTHPIAKAMEKMVQDANVKPLDVICFRAERGRGVSGVIDNVTWRIGSKAMMDDAGIGAPTPSNHENASHIYVARAEQIVGIYAVRDDIHPKAHDLISALKLLGIVPVMITGDQNGPAKSVAEELGISIFHSQTLPQDKARLVRQLQDIYGTTAFLGDGINDAPAMAQADVGLAIGTGSDIAIESSDVVLVNGDPSSVLVAYRLASATMTNIKQNLIWAFGYNTVLIPVAAGLLVPFGFGMLNPMLAGAAMAISSVCVVSNALRLRYA
jgi:Cu+-exporting ATPase